MRDCSRLCLARVPVTHPLQAGMLWSIPVGFGAGAGGCLWGWAQLTPIRCWPSHLPSASLLAGASSPRYISKDWRGVPSRLDAAMAGRIYVASQQPRRRKSRRQRKRYKSHRSLNLGFWSWLQNDSNSAGVESDWLSGSQCETLQSVYFFVGGESGAAGSRRGAEPGLPGQGEVSSRFAMSLSSGMQWEGAQGWQRGLAAPRSSALTAISPSSQTSTTASTCAPSAWTWCSPATRAPSPSTGWTARSPGRGAPERAPPEPPGSAAPS